MIKIVSSQSIKRPCSAIAGASGSAAKKRSRKPVEISDDSWLEALKFLNGRRCSKMRLVSRQLNGVVERNFSRLLLAIIDRVEMILAEREKTEVNMIVADSTIVGKKDQWFMDRDIGLDLPADIQLNNAIIGVELKKNCCADLCILGPAQEQEPTPHEKTRPCFFRKKFETDIIFSAEFSPHRNKYSWASMAYFLKLLYDPSTYVKELSMYAIDKKLKKILFPGRKGRHIRCGTFTLQVSPGASIEDICESLYWLEQNVRADITLFSNGILLNDRDIWHAIATNYLRCSSWRSAGQVVNLGKVNDLELFFEVLLKKFRINTTVQSIFPIIVLSGDRRIHDDPLEEVLSGKDIIRNGNYRETYTISKGANRMRIEFVREPEKRDPRVRCNWGRSYRYDIRVTVKRMDSHFFT